MEEETEEEEALLEPEAEPELEPVPEVSRDDRDVHSQNVDVVSAGGASLPKAETVSFTEGVDVFLSCPSGESDRKLAFTSSRSDPLELTEVTLRASPLSPPPPWYGL